MGVKINHTAIISSIAVVVCLSALILITWGVFHFSDRGFELSDETFYLYFSNNFDSDIYLTTAFGVLNKLFCFGSPTLIKLRIAKFVYQSIAVLVFSFSLLRYLEFRKVRSKPKQRLLFIGILLLSSYVNYDYLPMTMSYNTWSLILSLLCVAVIFHEKTRSEIRSHFITSLLFGVVAFALFLAKFPNAFILLFFYLIVNLRNTKQEMLIKAMGLITGTIFGFLIFLHSIESLKGIVNNYWLTIFEVKHDPVHPYMDQVTGFLRMCWEKNYLLLEAALIILVVLLKKSDIKSRSFIFYSLMAVNFWQMIQFRKGNGAELYNDFIAVSLLLINIMLYTYMFSWRQKQPTNNVLWWCLMLLPFGLMYGTNNEFYYTVSQLMIFAVAGMLLLLIAKTDSVSFLALCSVAMVCFVLSVLYQGAVKQPYRQSDLTKKMYPVEFSPELKGIVESKERMIDQNVMNEALKRINTSGKPVMQFFSHFGIHYLNGCKIFPQSQITDNERLMYINDYVLKRYSAENNCDVIVMSQKTSQSTAFIEMFRRNGIILNENFKRVFTYKFMSTDEETVIYKRI